MKSVYLAVSHCEYEGDHIYGIFSTFEAAAELLKTKTVSVEPEHIEEEGVLTDYMIREVQLDAEHTPIKNYRGVARELVEIWDDLWHILKVSDVKEVEI